MSRVNYRHGLVIGKFYPPHLGHEYLIRTAARHCAQVTVAVLGSGVESVSIQQREHWLRDMLADLAHVSVVGAVDNVRIDYHDAAVWQAHVDIMKAAVAQADCRRGRSAPPVDAVFTSEIYGAELARHFDAVSVCLDQQRALYPVSGTAVRADVAGQWRLLPAAVRAGLCARIVIVGAESTGTTTLAQDLTQALRERGDVWAATRCVAEYGREYSANLLALARASHPAARPQDLIWTDADFVDVAHEQNRREEAAARAGGPVLVCDTDALATCIWQQRYMGHCTAPVRALAMALPPRALYVLTDHVDVAFEDDGLRDGEQERPWMTEAFAAALEAQSVPWLRVRGDRAARLDKVLEAVATATRSVWSFALPLEQRTPDSVA